MDVVKEDIVEVEVTENTEDGTNWRWKIHCGDH